MAGDELPAEKLRAYLRELKPEARALLLAELERAVLRGEGVPGGDVVLQELRSGFRNAPRQPLRNMARLGNPARLFFAPLEPFLVDDPADRQRDGRISRAFLEAIWQLITRDLVPAQAKAYSEELERVLADEKECGRLVRSFQDLVVQRAHEMLISMDGDDRARRRLAGQIGLPRALETLDQVLSLLKARDALAVIGSRLPAHIRNLADDQLDNVKALLDSPVARHPDIFTYALTLVMGRLAAPWQLVRLAVRAAESDHARRIADTPFAIAVSIVLGEIDHMVGNLRTDMKRGEITSGSVLLKDIHDAVRVLRTEMDLAGDSPWARQLASLRVDVSNLIKAEIDSLPGRMRRLLRPRAVKDIAPGSVLDSTEVAETEALIEFAGTCRSYAGELAINEVTQRVQSELQNSLDTGTTPLLDALRGAGDSDRSFRLSQVDAAVRFAGKVFGAGYASLLTKAAEVAGQGERKAVKA